MVKNIEKFCLNCGKTFFAQRDEALYCSTNCRAKYNRLHKGTIFEQECKNCGKQFTTITPKKIFCCKECKTKYYVKNPIRHEYILICHNCGIVFTKFLTNKPKDEENHYCSQKCVIANKIKVGIGKTSHCKQCGEEFLQQQKTHIFCCTECKTIYGMQHPLTKVATCSFCGKEIIRVRSKKSKNFFCCRDCESAFRMSETEDVRICEYCKKEFKCKKRDKLRFCSKGCQISGINKSPTVPHRTVINFLLNTDYLINIEHPIARFSIDIYFVDLDFGVEVCGQYWHCDNRVYAEAKTKAQSDGILKDKKKALYLRKQNIPILYLWEYDINRDFDMCKKLIMEFVEKNGILNNYHSMNYEICEDKLKLKNEILIPHFEK